MVSGLYKPTKGTIRFDGTDITLAWNKRSKETLKSIQLIFQNPGRSLNPSHTVEQIIARPMKRLALVTDPVERRRLMVRMLRKVDLGEEYLSKKPRQLSGGEQQRVAIARALSISRAHRMRRPDRALDVPSQPRGNLLNDIQLETDAAICSYPMT